MGGCLSRNEETVSINDNTRPPSSSGKLNCLLKKCLKKKNERDEMMEGVEKLKAPIINLSHDSTIIFYHTYILSPLLLHIHKF